MKNIYTLFVILSFALIYTSCKKSKPTIVDPPVTNTLEGGTGGNYTIAVFSKHLNKSIASRVYLKYAADKMPADTNKFDEKYNTMTEPGLGHHAHFKPLKKGTYYIHIQSNNTFFADSVLVLNDTTSYSRDIYFELK